MAAPSEERNQAVKRWAILIIGALFILGLAYGSGLRQGNRGTKAARAAQKEAESRLSAVRADLADRETTIRLLEARRQLHLTLMALDARNFGIAQSHLSAAAILLGNVQGATRTAELEAMAQQVRGTSVVAAGDFAEQRARVLDFATRLDRLIPAEALPGHGMSAPGPARDRYPPGDYPEPPRPPRLTVP